MAHAQRNTFQAFAVPYHFLYLEGSKGEEEKKGRKSREKGNERGEGMEGKRRGERGERKKGEGKCGEKRGGDQPVRCARQMPHLTSQDMGMWASQGSNTEV